MSDRKQAYNKIFFAVSSLATIIVLTEIIMQLFGTTICHAEGCKVVSQHLRYGDISILLIGLGTFSVLAGLSFLNLYLNKKNVDPLINLVVIVSLASEGFFTGYQAFAIHIPCVLCLIIFGMVVLLSVLRLLAGEIGLIAGFVSLIAVFSMFYLVLPATNSVTLPADERFILFYSKDCRHCAEVLKDLDEKKIVVKHVEVGEYAAYLKSMGIDTVPTLMVNAPYQKLFITGKDAILTYLVGCTTPQPVVKEKSGLRTKSRTQAAVPARGKAASVDIFNLPFPLTSPSLSATNDGICKQDEVCK